MLELGTTEKIVMYILFKKEWVSTKAIVELLGKINKSETAVRATLFRLRKKKLIKDLQKGRETLFSIAPLGQEIITGYLNRISRAKNEWNGKWLLFSFNIPEKKRKLRNTLRNELIFLGFGRLHTNLWICPYDIREDCNKIIEKLKIKDHTAMFISDYIGTESKALAFRVWNLEELSKFYEKLTEKHKKEFEKFKKSNFTDDSKLALEAIVRLIKLKKELVELSSKEPFLPRELLPDNWSGYKMEKLFFEYLQFLYRKSSPLVEFNSDCKELTGLMKVNNLC